ncbi:MAG: hypothetical protein J0M11_01895 [Anaerolineae bacterium]|nr:hypothetical protein [Anaerolineae bacterium]
MSHPIVDRKLEFGLFRNLLDSTRVKDESILLLKNESGQGKSRLLHLFETHCRENRVPVSRVDFKGGSLSPIDVLRSIQTDVRSYFQLKRCSDILNQVISIPQIQIADNTNVGRSEYTVQTTFNMAPLSIEEQRTRWEMGAQALLEDINELSQNGMTCFVVLFDTYEQASEEARKWLSNHILRMSTPQRIRPLVIVIAGKEVPNPTGEWEHCHTAINLEPLQLEDWMEYARLVIGDFQPEQIKRVYTRHKNSPLQMATVINALAPIGDSHVR